MSRIPAHKDVFEDWLNNPEHELVKNKWTCEIEAVGSFGTDRAFQFFFHKGKDKYGYYDQTMRFILDWYPDCCAFYQMNHFTYSAYVTEQTVHALIEHALKCMMHNYSTTYGQKLILNTVRRQEVYGEDEDDDRVLKRNGYEKNAVVPEEELTKELIYPWIHSWAKKQSVCIDTPIVNHNTKHIIHHLIVFPDVCNGNLVG
jgi:hypothetical protein